MGGIGFLIQHFTYVAILAILVAAGLGLPAPEELVVLSSGVLSARGTLNLFGALGVCWAGVLLGDSLIYLVGRRLGVRVLHHRWFRRLFTPRLAHWLARHYTRHGVLTVMAARHVGGVRAAAFVLAGITHMPFRRFIAADALSALLSVPIGVFAGYYFGGYLPRILRAIHGAHQVILAVLAVIAVVATVVTLLRRRARDRAGVPEIALHEIEEEILHTPGTPAPLKSP